MALTDKISSDNLIVFENLAHFASEHTWNGRKFVCVTDEETALKRKNNNVVDVSWDNNTIETVLYVRKTDFPGRAMPNEHGFLDNKSMKILQVNEDMGMLTILLSSYLSKAVG